MSEAKAKLKGLGTDLAKTLGATLGTSVAVFIACCVFRTVNGYQPDWMNIFWYGAPAYAWGFWSATRP